MNIYNFLEIFLPDFEQKKNDYLGKNTFSDWSSCWYFTKTHFVEALQNYTDIICERQIESCVNAIEYGYNGFELRDCKNARQPNINEITAELLLSKQIKE